MEHEDNVNAVAFSPDRWWVASGGGDNTVRVWEAATGADGSYIAPPLPVGKVRVVCEAGPQYTQTTPSCVELPVTAQGQAAADFGLWAEEKPGRGRYHLRATADKSQAFTVFTALQNLADKAEKVTVTFDVAAEAEEPFDPVWLRNAVEEPLEEADVEIE